MSTMNAYMREIQNKYKDCNLCGLCDTRRNILFGSGSPNAKVLIIKDMPTNLEDKHDTFFTDDMNFVLKVFKDVVLSKRGRFTDKEAREILAVEAYVTSAVSCRGEIQVGDNAGNTREPKLSEIKACRDRVLSTIYAIDPNIIIACGKSAAISILKRNKDFPSKAGTLDSIFTIDVEGKMIDKVRYSAIYTHDIKTVEKVGDYDDPNGFVSQFCSAIESAWIISDSLEREK